MDDIHPVMKIHRRHTARLLSGLEHSECPREHLDFARFVMQWERSDLLAELVREKDVAPDADKN